MDSGRITEIKNRSSDGSETFDATTQPDDRLTLPLAILINRKSASASELVAGSLQYHNRAIVVGSPSYGKGSIQKVYPFENEDALKLTVGHYYLPDDSLITQSTPVTPDIVIETPTRNQKKELQEAIEKLSISTPQKKELLNKLSQLPAPKRRAAIPWHLDFQERLKLDPQLAAAWSRVTQKP